MTMHGPYILLYFLLKTVTFHWYVVRLAEENEICKWRNASSAAAPVELIESNQQASKPTGHGPSLACAHDGIWKILVEFKQRHASQDLWKGGFKVKVSCKNQE